jgi:hypothetical protein
MARLLLVKARPGFNVCATITRLKRLGAQCVMLRQQLYAHPNAPVEIPWIQYIKFT